MCSEPGTEPAVMDPLLPVCLCPSGVLFICKETRIGRGQAGPVSRPEGGLTGPTPALSLRRPLTRFTEGLVKHWRSDCPYHCRQAGLWPQMVTPGLRCAWGHTLGRGCRTERPPDSRWILRLLKLSPPPRLRPPGSQSPGQVSVSRGCGKGDTLPLRLSPQYC